MQRPGDGSLAVVSEGCTGRRNTPRAGGPRRRTGEDEGPAQASPPSTGGEREREVQDTLLGRAAPQSHSRGPEGPFEATQKQHFQVGVMQQVSRDCPHSQKARESGLTVSIF